MGAKDENELLERVKDGDEQALKILNKLYGNVVNHVADQIFGKQVLAKKGNFRQEHNDFIDQRIHFVWNCAKSFDPEKNSKFSTWVYSNARWSCLKIINANTKSSSRFVEINAHDYSEDGIFDFLSSLDSGTYRHNGVTMQNFNHSERIKNIEDKEIIEKISNLLLEEAKNNQDKDKASQAFYMRISDPKNNTWQKIGDTIGCCKQQARNLYLKKAKKIKKKIKTNDRHNIIR